MVVGYKIACPGLSEPQNVKGDTFDECLRKFRDYWENDYDVHTDNLTIVQPIDIAFDIL